MWHYFTAALHKQLGRQQAVGFINEGTEKPTTVIRRRQGSAQTTRPTARSGIYKRRRGKPTAVARRRQGSIRRSY
jgi:hypothetical protein